MGTETSHMASKIKNVIFVTALEKIQEITAN